MNTRLLLSASAIVMAVLGLTASFVPREILIALGSRPEALEVLLVQLTGAPYLGFAMLSWTARGSLIARAMVSWVLCVGLCWVVFTPPRGVAKQGD